MVEEVESKNTKEPTALGPLFYVCMIGGIFGGVYFLHWGDSIVGAGLECGLGAGLGLLVYFAGRYLLSGRKE